MADDAPEVPAPRRIKVSPDRRMVAIESDDFKDDPEQIVQSFTLATARGMSGYKTAEQVSDWTDV